MSRIYTRKGDLGETSLGDNRRVKKTDPRIEAVGTLDELNSALGLAIAMLPPQSTVRTELIPVQHRLFTLGARLAVPGDADQKIQEHLPMFPAESPEALEKTIDRWWQALPPLTQFILPGGTPAASAIHLARAICRRAERNVIALRHQDPTINASLIVWLNRLSDFLFAAARYANFEQSVADVKWQK